MEDLLAVIDRDGSGAIEYSEFEEMFGDANAGQLAGASAEPPAPSVRPGARAPA